MFMFSCRSLYRIALLSSIAASFEPVLQSQTARTYSVLVDRPSPSLYSHQEWPKAIPSDVNSIEAVVKAFYEAISAESGHKLDRTRLRSLFVPDGRIAAAIPPRKNLPADVIFRTPDQYADDSDAYTTAHGFFDSTPAYRTEFFGLMAHVYSTYESRAHPSDEKPMARGVKSFELLKSGDRWWIVEVYWDAERPDNPLPPHYSPHSDR